MTKSRKARFAFGFVAASLLGLIVGCGAPSSERINPQGGYPDVAHGNVGRPDSVGVLVVATPIVADESSGRTLTGGPDVRSPVVHTGYSVYSPDGVFIQHVRNHSMAPSGDEPPAEVELSPGRYLIRPDVPVSGNDAFWVTIEPDRNTRVDVARIEEEHPPQVR
jgi:hypothetical protein